MEPLTWRQGARASAVALLAALALAANSGTSASEPVAAGLATIVEKDVSAHLAHLATAEFEGRDTPSVGQSKAAEYVRKGFSDAGLEPVGGDSYFRSYSRSLPEPVRDECSLTLTAEGAEPHAFAYGKDFVPVTTCTGGATGELVFCGFGINSKREHFIEVEGRALVGKIALILQGEPRHPKLFDGPEESPDATLWTKLVDLRDAKVAGVLVARRKPAGYGAAKSGASESAELSFRYTWATWATENMTNVPEGVPHDLPPTLEVSMECANALLGEDVEELAKRGDKSGKPLRKEPKGRTLRMSSMTRTGSVSCDNIVGLLRGSDPALAEEVLVIGAHYDHIGVDDRGRIGFGADDNASGTAALVELMQALAVAKPRRSVLACAFSGEEDGLLGSHALCNDPPIPIARMIAMINIDMLGRGEPEEMAVLGIVQNPTFEKLIDRGQKLAKSGVKKVIVRQGEELFERSDHFSFHEKNVPVLFFFEGLPIEKNPDYHTWRDTIESLDIDKIARSTRLVFNCAWLLANDDEKPPRPRE